MRTRMTLEARTIAAIVATALAVAACGGSSDDNDAPQPSYAPTISAIGNRSINQDTTDSGVAFEVGDQDGGAAALSLTASSSDTLLLPASGVVLGGTGAARTLTLTPVENATGDVTVTITATDAQQLSTRRTFVLTVNPVFVSFTGWTIETFAVMEDDAARPLVGFTLNGDANEADAPFAPLLQ